MRAKGKLRGATLANSFAAHWKVFASLPGQETGLRHINAWNTFSFNKHIFAFYAVALRTHQFVVMSWVEGEGTWWRRRIRNLQRRVFGYIGILEYGSKSRFCDNTVLRLYERLPWFSRGGF